MQFDIAQCVNKGMQRDYSMDKASQEFAYENKNIRITTTGNNSFLSVTNEKSTEFIMNLSKDNDNNASVYVLGSASIGNYIVVFTKEDGCDCILRVDASDENDIKKFVLYEGNLDFSIDNPVECTTSYEADSVQKVYWVDGKNQPRYIDVATDTKYPSNETFTFVPIVSNNIQVSIEKQNDGAGNFESGVVQYYITGYKKYGAESNAIYVSPLYYISPSDRGGKPGDKQTCSFKLTINIGESTIDHVRVYSVCRFTKNATPLVTIVQDVSKEEFENDLIVIDTNNGTPVASTDVMFLGGNTLIASTIEQKDNTLFLGNVEIKSSILSDSDITNMLTEDNFTLEFGLKAFPVNNSTTTNIYYPYKPYMNGSSETTTTFKYLEWYRFGIQFQLNTLEWTPTYFLKDLQNTINPVDKETANRVVYNPYSEDIETEYLTMINCQLSESFINYLIEKGIVGWRLMIAQHDSGTRTIKAQGLVLPTQFNLGERLSESCYSTPIWTLNQCLHGYHYVNVDSDLHTSKDELTSVGEILYNKSLTYKLLPNTLYYNKDASDSSKKLDAYVLDNLFTDLSIKTLDNYYCVSIIPTVCIHRMYTWEDEWGDWGDYTGDVFYAKLNIKVSDGNKTNTYTTGRNTTWTSESNSNITHVKKWYGNRKNGCNELSNNLVGLYWSDIGEFYIQGLKKSDGTTMKVKELSNYTANNKLFLDGEIPSGGQMRDWVSPSSEIDNNLGELIRNFTFTNVDGIKKNYSNNFFIDANTCNFISPDVDNIEEDMSFRIVGSVDITNVIADYNVTFESNIAGSTYYKTVDWIFNNYKCKIGNTSLFTGIHSYPLLPYNNRLYFINYWNQDGSVIGDSDKLKLKTKKFANMWYLDNNVYYTNFLDYSKIYDLEVCEDGPITIASHIYKPTYENLLFPTTGIYGVKMSNEGNPINESFPLNYVDSLIQDGKSFEGYARSGTVSIKNKASKHAVFKLPSGKQSMLELLPNYKIGYGKSADLFGSTNSTMQTVKNARASSNKNFSTYSLERVYNARPNTDMECELSIYDYQSPYDFKEWTLNIDTPIFGPGNDYLSIDGIKLSDLTNSLSPIDHKFNIFPNLIVIKNYGIIIDNVTLTSEGDYWRFYKATVKVINLENTPINYNNYVGVIDNTGFNGHLAFNYKANLLYSSKSVNDSSKIFIGEFYVPYNPSTFMGGDSQNAKELNTYIPISGVYSMACSDGYAQGYGLEGDTYYQRWDHVRISPISDSDTNQPMDALSVMLETYTNLDGDYRTMRGRLDAININPENTNNLVNDVYSQNNNYITSSILDEKFNDSEHSTMYIWSLPKQPMGDIDNWTQIRTSSAGTLDGDKGILTKIINWNNKLLAFQEKGISVINYNNQTTISQNEGVPVEIANSGKVTGHYYISTSQGCKNKWSITSSPYSLYFIDSYNKSINAFTDKITPISTTNLFSDWIIQNEYDSIWKPNGNPNFGFRSFYDPVNKDVYFVNGEHCLCYNELLSQFTSFYDYEKMDTMNTVNGHVYSICGSKLYKMFEGEDYCNLFGSQKPYYMTYKINKDPFIDKTWTNIEYRADIFESGIIGHKDAILSTPLKTFDKFEVWNEYQYGISNMSKARCKFRIWREQIPRDTREDTRGFNRIRNPWIMLKLEKTTDTDKRMEFHDLLIKYLR